MSHDHLSFLKFGEGSASSTSTVGGGLQVGAPGFRDPFGLGAVEKQKTPIVMQAEIVTYLQKLTAEQKVTNIDILRELGIDLLRRDRAVMPLLKNNPKVICTETGENAFQMQYRAKFDVQNANDLLNLIQRVQTGVSDHDVADCYHGVRDDIKALITSGQVIACKNKEKDHKDIILYPRYQPFFVGLSGEARVVPGKEIVEISSDITGEIRRGDAVLLGDNYFRVDCRISGGRSNQPERAKAPLSVSSIESHDLRGKNKYYLDFTDKTLPLDREFDGTEAFSGRALKHGCTNDIRDLWIHSFETAQPFLTDQTRLQDELIRLKLLTRPGSDIATKSKGSGEPKQKRMKKAERQNRFNRQTNTHLIGTELGGVLKR